MPRNIVAIVISAIEISLVISAIAMTSILATSTLPGVGETVLGASAFAAEAAPAGKFHNETHYTKILAKQKACQDEFLLWDRTRCDLADFDAGIAWEVDWVRKYTEAIGQALYYAIVLDLRPGVVLLVKDRTSEIRSIYRCQVVCAKYGIAMEIVNARDLDPSSP